MRRPTMHTRCKAGPNAKRECLLYRCCQLCIVGVHDKYSQQFRGLGVAGVGAYSVMVAGSLGEIFTLLEHPDLSAIHLAPDRAFENGSVDKCGFGVRVSGGRPAGSVFDEYAL